MTAIADISDLINRATGGSSGAPDVPFFHKVARSGGVAGTALIAGRAASLWRYDGQPSAGAIPGAVSVPTNLTPGAIPIVNPAGGREKWLVQAWATGLVGGTLLLYDRLLHIGGLNGTTATPQNVQNESGVTLTRNAGGAGNIAFAEIYTAIGTAGVTISMSYTNQDGTPGKTSTATSFGNTGFREVTRAILMPLASGDTGIRSVETVTHATTGTAGNYGITIGRPLAWIGIGSPGAPGWRDYTTGMPGIPKVEADSCLSLLWFPTTTTVPEIFGGAAFVEA